MRAFLIFLICFATGLHAQVLTINWNENFQKEILITCAAEEAFCEKFCSAASSCLIQEGFCRDCIGTSLRMNYILSELGQSIQNSGERIDALSILSSLKSQQLISLTSQDVYNVIDPMQSIKTLKKFESLCPADSLSQIMFIRVNPKSRTLEKPEMVYCDFGDRIELYRLLSQPRVIIQDINNS